MTCTSNASSKCDGVDVYITDPNATFNDSLLNIDVSCDTDDCVMFKVWCPDITNSTTSCTRELLAELTPLFACDDSTSHCEVRLTLVTWMLMLFDSHHDVFMRSTVTK